MTVLKSAICRPAERSLQREAIYQTELLPHYHAGSRFSRFLYLKVTRVELEIFVIFAEQKREDPFLQSVCFLVRAPVHKQILGARVPMIVAVKKDVAAVLGLAHHNLGRVVLRAQLLARRQPLSVQVQTTQTAPVVADNHSVRV